MRFDERDVENVLLCLLLLNHFCFIMHMNLLVIVFRSPRLMQQPDKFAHRHASRYNFASPPGLTKFSSIFGTHAGCSGCHP